MIRKTAVVWWILVIAVLNVWLGYALAVYLGYGPPHRAAASMPLATQPDVSPEMQQMITEQLVEQLASSSIEQMLDDDPDDQRQNRDLEAYDEPEDEGDDVSSLLSPDFPEVWDLNEKYVETSLLKLNIAMMKSGAKATEIDSRLRACQGDCDRETILRCLAELKEDCQSYLAEQSEAAKRFSNRINELGDLSGLGEKIEMANLEEAAQVETTLNNLAHIDFESELEKANSRLLEEIDHLRAARHRLRDNQEAAFLAIARYEDRMDKIEARLHDDPLTGLHNRIGIEAALWQWWQQDRHKSRQISAVLFDLDDFNRVNKSYGSLTGDRILLQFARLIQQKVSKEGLVGRYAGQRFLVIMFDVGPRTATKNAELIRQSLEKITFLSGQEEIRVTTCGGYTEVLPDDSEEGLFERLEEALQHAKRAGPNCAFFHDGKQAELIESPNLGAQLVGISI